MRVWMLCVAVAAFAAAPLFAIDSLAEGPRELEGTVQWVPSETQQGSEDLAIVIGTGDAQQTVRFWSGGSVDSTQLEGLVGKQVGVGGHLHKYMDAWYVKAEKLSSTRPGDAVPKAPRNTPSPEEKASGLAASWFKTHDDDKLEPVCRIKGINGNDVDLQVMGQDQDGSFKSRTRVTVNLERLSIKKQLE
jgi:hypothetical protein